MSAETQEIERLIRAEFPTAEHSKIDQLLTLIRSIFSGDTTEAIASEQISSNPDLVEIVRRLSGKELVARKAVLDFGAEAQIGDFTVRDVISDSVMFSIHIHTSSKGEPLDSGSHISSEQGIASTENKTKSQTKPSFTKRAINPSVSLMRSIGTPGSYMNRVIYSTDGKTLAAFDSKRRVFYWSTKNYEQKAAYEISGNAYAEGETLQAISASQIWASAFVEDEGVMIWDVFSRQLQQVLIANRQWRMHDFSISPSGKLAAAYYIDKLVVRKITNNEKIFEHENRSDSTFNYTLFSPNDRYLAVIDRRIASIWDLNENRIIRNFSTAGSPSICFSPNNKLVAVGSTLGVDIVELKTGQITKSISAELNSGKGRVILTEGLIVLQKFPQVYIYNLRTGKREIELTSNVQSIQCTALSVEGHLAIGSSEGRVDVWKIF